MMSYGTVVSESLNKSKGSGQADWLKKLQEKKKEEQLAEKKRTERSRQSVNRKNALPKCGQSGRQRAKICNLMSLRLWEKMCGI